MGRFDVGTVVLYYGIVRLLVFVFVCNRWRHFQIWLQKFESWRKTFIFVLINVNQESDDWRIIVLSLRHSVPSLHKYKKMKYGKSLKTVVALLVFLCVPFLRIYAEHYVFQSISDGAVSLSEVNCIYREPDSYVWIGTPKGLYCYDGGSMRSYVHTEAEYSLPKNMVLGIGADRKRNLWVLTAGGVCVYDRTGDCFLPVVDGQGESVVAYSFCQSGDSVYLGGDGVIYSCDAVSRRLVPVVETDRKNSLRIDGIMPLDSGRLLCSNKNEGLFVLDTQTETFVRAPYDCPKEASAMLVSGDCVWIATYNHGLSCFDKISGRRTAFYSTQNSGLNNNVILSLVEQDSLLWIGTDGGGINILDPNTGRVTILTHRQADERSFPSTSIKTLYKDSNNDIWAGSVRNGVINVRKSMIGSFSDVPLGNPYGLSNPTVLCLYQEDGSPYVWIGTDGEGINRLDTRTFAFTHYPQTRHVKVSSIVGYSHDRLLLSLYAKGLFLFDPHSGGLTPLKVSSEEISNQLLYRRQTLNLYNESSGNVLMLGYSVYRYYIEDGRMDKIGCPQPAHVNGNLLPVGEFGGYTYIHDNQNLYRLGVGEDRMESISDFPPSTVINSASLDEDGNIWIASDGKVIRFDIAGRISEEVGLSAFKDVNSVMRDRSDRLWLGTNNGLYVYYLNDGRFARLGESDGVIHNEYLEKPMLRTPNGDIYLGGIRGLLHIDHLFSFDETDVPAVKLTEVRIDGNPVADVYLQDSPSVEYPWGSKLLTLGLMSEEKDIFRDRTYRLTIQDSDGSQNFESDDSKVNLRLLSPGEHKIFVSCDMHNGEWTEPQLIMTVRALPPWYQTLAFKLVSSLLFVAVIFLVSGMYYRRKANRLRIAMQEKEKDIYEQKVRFLINISHELRTPLTLIHAPLKRILHCMSPQDANFRSIENIFRQSGKMKELIDMVLDLRKMETGTSSMHFDRYRLNEWIENTVNDFYDEGEARGVKIVTELDSQVHDICFDKEKCSIVLNNFLMNALKHSPSGGTIRVVSRLVGEDRVRVSVADEGVGLRGVDVNKLFVRFYQGDGECSGTGIGLSYSKILVEQHNGKVGAENNPEKGATFFFEIPTNLQQEKVACESKPYLNELFMDAEKNLMENTGDSIDTKGFCVLVVDDSPEMLDFLKESLKDYFKEVYSASDGEEALKILKKHLPDIVVSDIMMPKMNGYELCKYIKSNIDYSHIPVVLLTARNEEQSLKLGYKIGANAYVPKPFDLETLIEILRSKLKQKEDIKQRYSQAILLPEPKDTTFSAMDENFLLKLNKIINENISNPELGVPFICQEIGLSRTSLYNKLKVVTGMGLNDYINKIKLEKAIALIKSSDMSFAEIADLTGFSTARYFSTTFKQYTGYTPTDYKECFVKSKK